MSSSSQLLQSLEGNETTNKNNKIFFTKNGETIQGQLLE